MLANILQTIFFPKFCIGCQSVGSYLCEFCQKNLTQKNLICVYCFKSSVGGVTHPLCQRIYGLDGLWSLGSYEGYLKKAILKLKYRFVSDLAKSLTESILEYWAYHQPLILDLMRRDPGNWVITAVPLHIERKNWRGFNQSELLAKTFAKELGILYVEYLQRTKNTAPQINLPLNKRRTNVLKAFSAINKFQIKNKSILLFDDVCTTGSTLKECAKIMKQAGAKQVWAITIAR